MPTNQYGYEVDQYGDLLPGQITPGMRDNPEAQLHLDVGKNLYYRVDKSGQRSYLSPYAFWGGHAPDFSVKGAGTPETAKPSGGGLVHGQAQWNPKSGEWDTPVDFGKILSLGVGGALGVGALGAAGVLGGGVGASPATSAPTMGIASSAGIPGAIGAPGALASHAIGGAVGGLAPTVANTGLGGNMGWLSTLLSHGSDIADVVSGVVRGRQQGTMNENATNLAQADTRARLYDALTRNLLAQGGLKAQRAAFELAAPTARAGQALKGDLLANVQDVRIPDSERVKVMHYTGGVRPSALGPNARAAGSALSNLSLSNLGKDTFQVPELPTAPTLEELKNPSGNWLDDLLGGASLGLNVASLFGGKR